MIKTLPTESAEREEIPLNDGVIMYFPAALMGVAKVSKAGNDKHNKGQPLHHSREKSTGHANRVLRHLTDLNDLLAAFERGNHFDCSEILCEASHLAWRALALSQELHERFGAPLAPGARIGGVDPARAWLDELSAIGQEIESSPSAKQERPPLNAHVDMDPKTPKTWVGRLMIPEVVGNTVGDIIWATKADSAPPTPSEVDAPCILPNWASTHEKFEDPVEPSPTAADAYHAFKNKQFDQRFAQRCAEREARLTNLNPMCEIPLPIVVTSEEK